MKVYLDNVIASARVREDLASLEERQALRLVQEHPNFGKLEIVTSRESWREQERTLARKPVRNSVRHAKERRSYRKTIEYWAPTVLILGTAASSRHPSSPILSMKPCFLDYKLRV